MSRCASRRRTGRLTGSESPESPAPDSLVFDRFRLSEWLVHRYLCKIFHRVGVLIVKSVNLNCRAQCARKSSPMARCLSLLSLHKSLFHRIFLNFRKVRKSLRRQSISRGMHPIQATRAGCLRWPSDGLSSRSGCAATHRRRSPVCEGIRAAERDAERDPEKWER